MNTYSQEVDTNQNNLPSQPDNDYIELNIGGQDTQIVSRSLLTKVEGSRLEKEFKEYRKREKFIDRDYESFREMLHMLRSDG